MKEDIRSSVVDMFNLRCLLDIQVKMLSRKLDIQLGRGLSCREKFDIHLCVNESVN